VLAHKNCNSGLFKDFVPVLSRAQVSAEAAEAVRLGLASRGEASQLPSADELEAIRQAGLRADPVMAQATQ